MKYFYVIYKPCKAEKNHTKKISTFIFKTIYSGSRYRTTQYDFMPENVYVIKSYKELITLMRTGKYKRHSNYGKKIS